MFLVEQLMPRQVGTKNWLETTCVTKLSDTIATPADEAFIILCTLNMYDKWNGTTNDTGGKYTKNGTNRKGGGWSADGIAKYNELFAYAVRNRRKPWAEAVEEDVMMALKRRHFSAASLQEIRNSRLRKKRKRPGNGAGQEEEPVFMPAVAWDVSAVVEV